MQLDLTMGIYIAIKSTISAFRYGIEPAPEWFRRMSRDTEEVEAVVDGDKVKALDIRVSNGTLRAFHGHYIGMRPDGSITVLRPEDFHSSYTLKL